MMSGQSAILQNHDAVDESMDGSGILAPQHVAIIMDGNGRWAANRGLPRFEGHRRGVEAVRRTVKASIELDIKYLTIYSFSSENWSRPASEVSYLMGLLKRFIRNDLSDLHAQNVRVRIIGERTGISDDMQLLLDDAQSVTANNTGLTLIVAFNYGARQEIVAAAKLLARQAVEGLINPDHIDAAIIERALMTDNTPHPDLLIRTSGEQRLSNFLLWQLAYTEFVFLPVLWPDFAKSDLEEAIVAFNGRNRRFGGTP
jgi:undecaprenyl diphosphate synthase